MLFERVRFECSNATTFTIERLAARCPTPRRVFECIVCNLVLNNATTITSLLITISYLFQIQTRYAEHSVLALAIISGFRIVTLVIYTSLKYQLN